MNADQDDRRVNQKSRRTMRREFQLEALEGRVVLSQMLAGSSFLGSPAAMRFEGGGAGRFDQFRMNRLESLASGGTRFDQRIASRLDRMGFQFGGGAPGSPGNPGSQGASSSSSSSSSTSVPAPTNFISPPMTSQASPVSNPSAGSSRFPMGAWRSLPFIPAGSSTLGTSTSGTSTSGTSTSASTTSTPPPIAFPMGGGFGMGSGIGGFGGMRAGFPRGVEMMRGGAFATGSMRPFGTHMPLNSGSTTGSTAPAGTSATQIQKDFQQLTTDQLATAAKSTVTVGQIASFEQTLRTIEQTGFKADAKSVNAFATDLMTAVAGGTYTSGSSTAQSLQTQFNNLFTGSSVPAATVTQAYDQIVAIAQNTNVTTADLQTLKNDRAAIASALGFKAPSSTTSTSSSSSSTSTSSTASSTTSPSNPSTPAPAAFGGLGLESLVRIAEI